MTASLNLRAFGGLLPRVPATALPLGAAQAAANIDFTSGELRSLRGGFKLRDLSMAARSVYTNDGLRFYAWAEDVSAVPSPLQAGQASDMLYYTTESDFRVTRLSLASVAGDAPSTSYRVGVPRPTVAPAVTVVHPPAPAKQQATVEALPADTYTSRLQSAQAALDAQQTSAIQTRTETRAYTYTYANTYNEEGPPSPAATVEVKAVTYNGVTTYSTVTVEATFDGSGPYVPINSARVYRTSGSGADYYFAFALSGTDGKASGKDTVAAGALNEVLSSFASYPPDPLLQGLVHLGNGILAAWKGRELWFSDAYRPWSWPPAYMKTFQHSIVGAIKYGAGALVTTVAEPLLVSGVTPDAMTELPLDIPQAGVSKWAMLTLNGMALYASNDGIVAVVGGQPNLNLSERYFTREHWRKRCGPGLASMQFAHYDGRLIVFSKANAFVPFMLELDQADGAMTDLPDLVASTALVLVTSDQMYTVNGTALVQFGGGDALPLRWMSGDLVLPSPSLLAAAQAECEGDFTLKVYQKGKLGYTKQLHTGSETFRLPSQPIPGHNGLARSDRWQFEITGTGTFKWLKAAGSMQGLKEA